MSTELPLTTDFIENAEYQIQYELIPPLLLLIIFTCVANIVVILCIYCHRPLRKPNNLYVISLAAVDAIVGLVVMSGMLVFTIYGLWPLSQTLCTIWTVTDFSCCTISMIHLCLIAHDRYLALATPMQYRQANRRRINLIYIAITWIVGFLSWMPAIVWYHMTHVIAPFDCLFLPSGLHTLIQSVVIYYIPISLMVIFYIQCLHGLRVQYMKIDKSLDGKLKASDDCTVSTITDGHSVSALVGSEDVPSSSQPTNIVNSASFERTTTLTTTNSTLSAPVVPMTTVKVRQEKKKRRRQEHIRSIRTLGVIILIFLFCWAPFCIFWPIQVYCPGCIPAKWYEYSYWAAYLNSSINPLLYFLCNKDFRVALKKLLRR